MDEIFYLKLFLSFLIGGAWVVFTTVFSDRFGTKIGGTISGLPSTVLFSLLFIALTQSPQAAVASTTLLPAIGGVVALFMAWYIYFVKRNFWFALISACSVWALLSFCIVLFHPTTFLISLLMYLILFFIAYYLVEKKMYVPSVSGKKIVYTPWVVLFRGVFSGGIVALAVLLAKISGPVIGGVFAIFPATTISIILITYFEHGASFSAAMVKSIFLSMTSVIIYAIFVRYTYVPLGITWGTILAAIASILTVWALFHTVVKKIR
jgi:Protein of unknown function (DUF3147)